MKAIDLPLLYRRLWNSFDIESPARERLVDLVERLELAGCRRDIALRTALDDWLAERVRDELSRGVIGEYLWGPHWERIKRLSALIAERRCEGWVCDSQRTLQRHHLHYASVGQESLFDVAVLCDRCHERLTYGDIFYEWELHDRRVRQQAERAEALRDIERVGDFRGATTLPEFSVDVSLIDSAPPRPAGLRLEQAGPNDLPF